MPYTEDLFAVGSKLTAAQVTALQENFAALGGIVNLGFTATIDTPAAGDITIALKQADGAADPDAAGPVIVGFSGNAAGLKLTGARGLKLDATDHLGLGAYPANTETTLFLYAIDRGGTLEWGLGRRPDYTRATADFVATEGTATSRDKVFCTAAITANDPCRVAGFFKATFNTGGADWDSVTADSEETGPPLAPHPRLIAAAWITFDGTGTIAVRNSENVSSIIDNGTGNFTVNWDTPFPDANYAVVASSQNSHVLATVGPAATGVVIQTHDQSTGGSVAYDPNPVCVVAFGDQ